MPGALILGNLALCPVGRRSLWAMSADAKVRAAPYSTGGGGVVLEHRYGATLIVALLTGDPLTELGDDAIPLEVRFQASAESPVDDLLVIGRSRDGKERRVSIGVRRAPHLIASDQATVSLLAAYVRVVVDHWDEVRDRRWRLALVTASRDNPDPAQLGELAVIARRKGSNPEFRAEVARDGHVAQSVRQRLIQIDKLVRAVAAEAGASATRIEAKELTWRLLSSLTVRESRLEGADTSDRTHAVSRLRNFADEADGAADDLFNRLAELVRDYAPAGANVTEEMLRRDLSGVPLAGTRHQSQVVPVFVATADARPSAEAPLEARWRAGEEGWLGGQCYLLLNEKAGLLREERDPSGQHIRRQALARQTDPVPTAGHAFAWLRMAGHDLTRERDLLARVLAASDAARTRGRPDDRLVAGLPSVAHYDATAGAVTLALSWPAGKDGLPCETLRVRFPPGSLDAWQVSLLLAGLRGVVISLERLHRLGASHRNLAPESIIVAGSGQFALRDLGLAAVGFRPGEGPASYQAPDQAFGTRMPRPGPATDVYQLGAIAYHLITGRVPGRGAPPARHPAVPDSVTDIISAALATSPAGRPSSRDLRTALLAAKPRPPRQPR
jgi:hypothetical protein